LRERLTLLRYTCNAYVVLWSFPAVTIPLSRYLVKSNSHTRTGALVTPSEGLIEKLNIKGLGANEGYRFLSDGTIQ
jgi:hypothetical protein